MKKRVWIALTVFLLIFSVILPLFSCTGGSGAADTTADTPTGAPTDAPTEEPTENPTETPTEEPTEAPTEPETEPEPVEPVSLITYETLAKTAEGEKGTLWEQNTATKRDGYVTLTSGGSDPWIAPLLEGKTADGETPATADYLAIKYRTDYSVAGQLGITIKRNRIVDFFWVVTASGTCWFWI